MMSFEGGSAPAQAATTAQPGAENTPVEQSQGENQQQQQHDDPEIDFGDMRVKRSEAAEIIKKRKEFDKGAHLKFQEAAKLRKEAEQIKAQAEAALQGLGKDAKAALRAAGLDPTRVAEQILAEALQEYQLTPEQREARHTKTELERLKAEKEKFENEQRTRKEREHIEHWQRVFDEGISGAMKAAGLPPKPHVVSRIAQKAEAYLDAGIEISFEEIAREVKEDLGEERRASRVGISETDAETLFDDEELELARKILLKRASGFQQSKPKPAERDPVGKPRKQGLTRAEFEERLRKRIGA